MPTRLLLRSVAAPLLQFTVEAEPRILGRADGCDFVVKDATVSRRHAMISLDNQICKLVDLDSLNGTFVEERRVTECRLSEGQLTRFGQVAFLLTKPTNDSGEEEGEEATASCPEEIESPEAALALRSLSRSQRRVFDVLLTGQSEKVVARTLRLSIHTVHNHVQAIFRLLDVHSKPELLARYVANEKAVYAPAVATRNNRQSTPPQ